MIIKIECDKDISSLSIDFVNGSDVQITTTNVSSVTPTDNTITPKPDVFQEAALDLDEDFTVEEEIVEKPVIKDVKRDVNVSDEMQNAEY